jgi:class 3 adenylate cyclase/tetratricopeptide (TPR) repeat protein
MMRPAEDDGDLRVLTIMFADVVNSTKLTECLGDQAWTGVINRVFNALSPPIQEHGGTLARLMGDGFLAFFGAPVTHEDDPARAVQAALDVIRAARGLAADLQKEFAAKLDPARLTFAIRVGVHTGRAVVGYVGSEVLYEYTPIGDAPNLAARLQEEADPMTVLISSATYRHVRGVFECQDRGRRQLKNRAQPVHLYRVIGRSQRVSAPSVSAPMVGRDLQLSNLLNSYARFETGRGAIRLIIGEGGYGKTRLCVEARRRLGDHGADWVIAHTQSFGRTISYLPFREILRECAGITENATDSGAWEALAAYVRDTMGESGWETLPYLATMLGLNIQPPFNHHVESLDAESMRSQVFRSVRRTLAAHALKRPLVLVVDDLHWMDESSLALLGHLLPLCEQAPLLFWCLSRPGSRATQSLQDIAAAAHLRSFDVVELGPLSTAESQQLTHAVLSVDAATEPLHDLLSFKAEGNPFFIEEVIHALIEDGSVSWDRGRQRWRARRNLEQVSVPDTVQGLIAARIGRLDDWAREVLRAGAVIGRTFPDLLLRLVLDDDHRIDACLRQLEDLALVRRVATSADLQYEFRHALIQQQIYDSTLDRHRHDLHRKVAAAIEMLFADRREEFYGILAYHFCQAEEWSAAHDYLVRAGDQAGRLAADAEALEHYRQALAAHQRVFREEERNARARFERSMGEALFRRGEHAQARQYLRRALGEMGVELPRPGWPVKTTIVLEALRQAWKMLRPVSIRPNSGNVDTVAKEQVQALRPLCWIDVWSDRSAFLAELLVALRTTQQSRDGVAEVQALSGLGLLADFLGSFGIAQRLETRALVLAGTLSDEPVAVGTAEGALGVHTYVTGRLSESREHYSRSATAFKFGGDVRGWGASTDGLGTVSWRLGDPSASIALGQELTRVGEETGDPQVLGWGNATLGDALMRLEDLEPALQYLTCAANLMARVMNRVELADTLGLLAQCHLKLGDVQSAQLVLSEAQEHIRLYDVRGHNVMATLEGLAALGLHSLEHNPSESSRFLVAATQACGAVLAHAHSYPIGLPAARRMMGTCKWLSGDRRAAQRFWRRSEAAAVAQGQAFEASLTCLEIGRRSGDLARHREAEAYLQAVRQSAFNAYTSSGPPDGRGVPLATMQNDRVVGT